MLSFLVAIKLVVTFKISKVGASFKAVPKRITSLNNNGNTIEVFVGCVGAVSGRVQDVVVGSNVAVVSAAVTTCGSCCCCCCRRRCY